MQNASSTNAVRDCSEKQHIRHAEESETEEAAKLDLIHSMNTTSSPVSIRCTADPRVRKLGNDRHHDTVNLIKSPAETSSSRTQDAHECCEATKAAQSELLDLMTITRSPVSFSRLPTASDSSAAAATYEQFHDIEVWMTLGLATIQTNFGTNIPPSIWSPEPSFAPPSLHDNVHTRSKCVLPATSRPIQERDDIQEASCGQEMNRCRSLFTSTKTALGVNTEAALSLEEGMIVAISSRDSEGGGATGGDDAKNDGQDSQACDSHEVYATSYPPLLSPPLFDCVGATHPQVPSPYPFQSTHERIEPRISLGWNEIQQNALQGAVREVMCATR